MTNINNTKAINGMSLCPTTLQHCIDVIKVARLERERFCDFVTIKVLDKLKDRFLEEIENVLAGMSALDHQDVTCSMAPPESVEDSEIKEIYALLNDIDKNDVN